MTSKLTLAHVELKEANAFVASLHRHHKPVVGHRFSLGAKVDGALVGVVIVGRTVARQTDWHSTVEVTRLCTNGHKNACSFLYGAAAKAAKALGLSKIQTFILDSETGTSLRATGWTMETVSAGGAWVHTAGLRRQDQPICPKQRWAKQLGET